MKASTRSLVFLAALALAMPALRASSDDFRAYFGNPPEAGGGWYYDEIFGFLYPFEFPWAYSYSLNAFLAAAGPGATEDTYYLWQADTGWSYLSSETSPWLYFFNEGAQSEGIEEGWYYAYGFTNGGSTPHLYYSHPRGTTVSTGLIIEIVNNTLDAADHSLRIPSDHIYLTLYGGSGTFSPPLEHNTSYLLTDPAIKHNDRVARFTTSGFSSGRIFLSFDSRTADGTGFIADSGIMPTSESLILPFDTSLPRNDKVEITYTLTSGTPGGSANLTAVDYFAIPLTLETLDSQSNVLQSFSFFDNTSTLLSDIEDIATDIASKAIMKDSNGNFLRALAPKEWANSSPPGAITDNPYPSMVPYLQHVSGQSVIIQGTFDGTSSHPAATYDYTGTLHDTGTITLTGTTNPGDSLPVTIQASDLEVGIYTANPPYTKGGSAGAIGDNDVYSAIVRDLLTGFNGGYIGGAHGSEPSDQWWHLPPFQPQDGHDYYNRYAQVIQNASQAYGFPFSDRLRQQLANFTPGVTTLRITILPDDFLNAPIVGIKAIKDTSITLDWDAVPGATGYTLTYSPGGTEPKALGNITEYEVTGLSSGTPYTFTLIATDAHRSSPGYPVQATTTGETPQITGPGQWQAALAFPPGMVHTGDTVTLNGITATITTSGQIEYQNGIVLNYTQVNAGHYGSTPSVEIEGGGGFNASANITMNGTMVGALTFNNPGFGYTSAPTVKFTGGTPVTTPAEYTVSLTTTTINQIPVPAPLNTKSAYAFSWKRADGTPVFESTFYVTIEGYQTPGNLNNGGLIKVSSGATDTYLEGNLNPASIDSGSPWVVNLAVQPPQ